LTASMSKMVLK